MNVLLGNWSGAAFRAIVAQRPNIGQLLSPAYWRQPQSPLWACDNDVYSAWKRGDTDWWCREGEYRWLKMLDKAARVKVAPLWILLPDVVAHWDTTIERAWRYRRECVERNLRVAVALQNGCCFNEVVPLRPDAVFVGGTTAWKWANAGRACEYFQPLGIQVHVGRASGPRRIRECLRVGVDSCDGTGWAQFNRKELPGLWQELDGTNPQGRLAL